jgi:peroxiredoxin Q/BCP
MKTVFQNLAYSHISFAFLGSLVCFALHTSVAAEHERHYREPVQIDGDFNATKVTPQISISEPNRSVEVVDIGKNVREIFIFSNIGSATLSLEIERTSCGCVGAELSSKTVAPGQSATLIFEMRASGWGTKTESVTLATNDPKQQHITLMLQAKMPSSVVPNPAQFTIEISEGETVQRYISLLLPEGASSESADVKQPFVSTKILENTPIADGSSQRIGISIAATAPPGVFRDELTIRLKNAPVPQISVPIYGVIKEDVQVEPSIVFLGQITPNTLKRKTFLVQSHSGKTFQIVAVQSSNTRIVVQANPIVKAASHAVGVEVRADDRSGSVLQESVRLTLSSGRVIQVPIIGMTVPPDAISSKPKSLKIGSPAPDFATTDASGNPCKLADFAGKNLLLTFFPKCFTGGCAGQLASLQDTLPQLKAANVHVIAISVDLPEEQRAFSAKLGLQFPLIPDTERTLCLLYGAVEDKTDLAARRSILIDKTGIVRWIETDVNVLTHGADVLSKIRQLGSAK